MGSHRIVATSVLAAALALALAPKAARAQPEEVEGEIEIEMDVPAEAPRVPAPPDAPDAAGLPVIVKDPKVAKKWVSAGNQLIGKGDALVKRRKPAEAIPHYENAVIAFEKAIEAGADANVAYQLAELNDRLGRYAVAVTQYRAVIAADRGASAATVKKATAKLDVALGNVGLVTLNITPDGASIAMSGAVLGTSPLPEPLVLMPGTYAMRFEADGFQPKEVEVKVDAGAELERGIDLEKIVIIVEPVGPREIDEPPAPAPVASGASRVPLIVGGVLTVGLAATAVVTGLLAVSEHDKFEDPMATTGARADAKVRGERLAKITDAAIGGALVAGAFTTVWYLVKYRGGSDGPAETSRAPVMSKFDLAPWVEPTAGGLSVLGSF